MKNDRRAKERIQPFLFFFNFQWDTFTELKKDKYSRRSLRARHMFALLPVTIKGHAPNPLFLEPTNFLKPFQSMVHYFCSKRFVMYSWQMIATWTYFQCRFHQFPAAFTIIGHTKDVACNLHVAQKHKKLSKTSCVVCLFYLSCGSINWVWPHLNLIIGQILQFNRTHWFH